MEPGKAPWFVYGFAAFAFISAAVEGWRAVRADGEDEVKSFTRLFAAGFMLVVALYLAAKEARLINDIW